MELDALGSLELQDLGQMPGDGLTFAVGVGGQDDLLARGRLADRGAEVADRLLAVLDHHVARLEAVFYVDRQLPLGEVADVAHRGAHVVAIAEEALESPGLGRGLHDDQTLRHGPLIYPTPARLIPPGANLT